VQNANLEDQENFKEVVFKILRETVDKGLDEETIQATLNRLEFSLRESDDAQKGLTYHFNQLNGWLFANDPFLNLEWEKPLAAIKAGLKEKYLESVIQQYFLDNPHALLLSLQPKPGMEKEINAQTAHELAAYKSTLSDPDLENLINETQELIAYQQKEDTPEALATIPSLSIEDINPKAQYYKIQKKQVQKVPVLYYNAFTNDVVYVRYLYDARVVPQDLIPYISLLAQVMGSLNTEHYTFGELEKELNLHTGGFSTYLGSYLKEQDDNQLQSKYIVAIKAMNTKIDKSFELSNEIILHTKYEDKERLQDVLTRHQSQLDASVKSNGYAYASRRLRSYYSNQGFFAELTSGIEYYWFITDLLDNFDTKADEIISNLQRTANLLFNKNNLIITITCDKSDINSILNNSKAYLSRQPTSKVKLNNWQFTPTNKKEGLMAASKVQYVILGANFKKLGYQWSGKLRVLDHILSSDWLYNQIRVVGGAYGAWINISTSGNVDFNSYRDPNLKETLEIYKGTIDYIHNFDVNQREMTDYIIGTIANLDNPLTPSEQGNVAVRYYFENITNQDVQKERDEVLSTTVKEIRKTEPMVSDILNQNIYCVYGNEQVIQENEALFSTVVKLNR
jgi:Zn-dependent M16 (insulinase) family peptidase